MKKLKGTAVSSGFAAAPPFFIEDRRVIPERAVSDSAGIEEELSFLNEAYTSIERDLIDRENSLRKRLGDEEAELIEGFREIVLDQEIRHNIESTIKKDKINAASAVLLEGNENALQFEELDDPYLRERASDIRELFTDLASYCSQSPAQAFPDVPSVFICSQIRTGDIIDASRTNATAFIAEQVMQTSHAAILARALGIPVVGDISLEEFSAADIKKVVVDGNTGEIIINPDKKTEYAIEEKERMYSEEQKRLRLLVDVPLQTITGEAVKVFANIGSAEEIDSVLDVGAEGIGLFRTEFLFIDGNQSAPPGEEQQFNVYKRVLESMDGRLVKIRTIDVGGDKPVPSLGIPEETNPFLGWRSVRYCLDNPLVLKTQLRALLRAAEYGSLAVMFPMISSLSEVKRLKEIFEEVRTELKSQDCPVPDNIPLGVMIETPAAALVSERLAEEVDFFSVGSNDLIQYTLAVDRTNEYVAKLYDPEHPAVSALMSMTVSAANKKGIPVGICGEMAGDTKYTEQLINLGFREFSMNAGSVLKVKDRIQSIFLSNSGSAK